MMYNKSVMNEEENKQLHKLRSLSELLDTRFEGPFGLRIGLDGILGFVPVVGDLITTVLSFGILISAANLGASPSTLIRMSLNILFENVVDMVPVLGSIFDIYWKANIRNMKILEAQLINPERASVTSRIVIVSIILLLSLILFLLAYLSWMAIEFFVGLLS
jgi:hypothetical protein